MCESPIGFSEMTILLGQCRYINLITTPNMKSYSKQFTVREDAEETKQVVFVLFFVKTFIAYYQSL